MQASLQGKYRERNNQIKIMFNVSIIILILVPLISCQTEVRLGMIKIRMAPSHLQEQIKVFSNYGDGLLTWGNEEVVTNYMELSEDPKGKRIRWSKPCHAVVQEICQRSSQSAVQSGFNTSQSMYNSSRFTRFSRNLWIN